MVRSWSDLAERWVAVTPATGSHITLGGCLPMMRSEEAAEARGPMSTTASLGQMARAAMSQRTMDPAEVGEGLARTSICQPMTGTEELAAVLGRWAG